MPLNTLWATWCIVTGGRVAGTGGWKIALVLFIRALRHRETSKEHYLTYSQTAAADLTVILLDISNQRCHSPSYHEQCHIAYTVQLRLRLVSIGRHLGDESDRTGFLTMAD